MAKIDKYCDFSNWNSIEINLMPIKIMKSGKSTFSCCKMVHKLNEFITQTNF